jgi:hypothetical protein
MRHSDIRQDNMLRLVELKIRTKKEDYINSA